MAPDGSPLPEPKEGGTTSAEGEKPLSKNALKKLAKNKVSY
jgi:hypothetical protein